jgi:hypothetical protein
MTTTGVLTFGGGATLLVAVIAMAAIFARPRPARRRRRARLIRPDFTP